MVVRLKQERLTPLERGLMATFEGETRRLKAEVDRLPDGLAKRLLSMEVELRRRRLLQWNANPTGESSEAFKKLTPYPHNPELEPKR